MGVEQPSEADRRIKITYDFIRSIIQQQESFFLITHRLSNSVDLCACELGYVFSFAHVPVIDFCRKGLTIEIQIDFRIDLFVDRHRFCVRLLLTNEFPVNFELRIDTYVKGCSLLFLVPWLADLFCIPLGYQDLKNHIHR